MPARGAAELDEVIAAAQSDRLADAEIAELARTLAASGEVLEQGADHADVASTGGPSSLSTLLCPLYLHALGARVAKLGVAGRPAGGVDVLATVPGYQPTIGRRQVEEALKSVRHVHLCAGGPWTPMDAELFRRRQEAGAQQVPSLVIASLLAKKLALGVTSAGLDVRVAAHGNFGTDPSSARANATRFVSVAGLLRIEAVCFLTDAARPYQPFIGRGEALRGLAAVVEGEARGPLAAHADECFRMAAGCLGIESRAAPSPALLASALDACLRAHGTGLEAFFGRVRAIAAEPRIEHRAPRAGRASFDMSRLRDLLVSCQKRDGEGAFSDPAGVVLQVREGSVVSRDDLLMTVRVPAGEGGLAGEIAACAQVGEGDALALRRSALLEVVSGSSGP
jgi:pyrimidine-nucleoside phosphorylase